MRFRAATARNLQDTVQEVLNAGVQAAGAQPDRISAALDLIAKVGPRLAGPQPQPRSGSP